MAYDNLWHELKCEIVINILIRDDFTYGVGNEIIILSRLPKLDVVKLKIILMMISLLDAVL